MTDRGTFHSQLKDVTRRYGRAMERYDQRMARGDVEGAEAALAEMQEIERNVTVIDRTVRR